MVSCFEDQEFIHGGVWIKAHFVVAFLNLTYELVGSSTPAKETDLAKMGRLSVWGDGTIKRSLKLFLRIILVTSKLRPFLETILLDVLSFFELFSVRGVRCNSLSIAWLIKRNFILSGVH